MHVQDYQQTHDLNSQELNVLDCQENLKIDEQKEMNIRIRLFLILRQLEPLLSAC